MSISARVSCCAAATESEWGMKVGGALVVGAVGAAVLAVQNSSAAEGVKRKAAKRYCEVRGI